MDSRSPVFLAALCLLVVGLGLVTVGAAGVTGPSTPLTYSVNEADGEARHYTNLSGPARELVDAGANRNEVVVDDLPSDFRSGSWYFVRNDGELVCLLPSDDADSGDVNVTFADPDGFVFEYGELSERGRTLFTAAMENPEGYVTYAGATPTRLGATSMYGVPVADAPERDGRYYVFTNERVYEFEINGQGPGSGVFGLIGAVLLIPFGLVLVAGSAYGYRASSVRAPAAVAAGASVYLVPPLVEAAGLLWWSIRLDGHHYAVPSVVALAMAVVAYVLMDLYGLERGHA